MNHLDRTVQPPLKEIEKIMLPAIRQFNLTNGIPVYSIAAANLEVIKVEFIFEAGRWQEPQNALAATTSKMLLGGTSSKTAQQIAEEIEYFGATIGTEATVDYGLVTLYCLTKHVDKLLPLLKEVISDPIFPDKELETYIQISKQRLMVSLEKVDFLANKAFNEQLYGTQYPAGYTTTAEDYDNITSTVLRSFHDAQYKNGKFKIIVAGNVTEHILSLLDATFGKEDSTMSTNGQHLARVIMKPDNRKLFFPKKDTVQSGIRIGKMLANKLHPDYPSLRVLNTILGGYFGSRLMQNLREDKGYCYGIHSSIASYLHDAHLYISTEVGAEVTWNAVKEIYDELDRLKTEIVSQEELQLVKNYLLGVYLGDVDGALNVAEVLRGLIVYGLDEQFFYNLIESVKSVTPEEIQRLAIKYFDNSNMVEVVVGDPVLSNSDARIAEPAELV
ncbi:MAG: insulinase family protein [Chitinophagales bacterium]|nr:insulinase family protein [Chitinophagales bacterium]